MLHQHASLALLAAGLLTGCSSMVSPPPGALEEVDIVWTQSGAYSHLSRPIRILARDPATLAQVPVTQTPVDFTTQMVLIAGMGPTPSSDLGIAITRVWRDGSRLRVREVQIHPGVDQQIGLRPASPWSVAVIPRSDLNVEGYSVRVPPGLIAPLPAPPVAATQSARNDAPANPGR